MASSSGFMTTIEHQRALFGHVLHWKRKHAEISLRSVLDSANLG